MKYALIAILTAALLKGTSMLLKRTNPRGLSDGGGMIRPVRWVGLATVLTGTAVVAGVLYGYSSGEITWKLALSVGLIGAAIAGFMAPSLTSRHDVIWDTNGMAGPSRQIGPGLGLRRTAIAWSEIAKSGKTGSDFWFVETHNGKRIYWSYLYGGYDALTAAIKAHRPDLALPDNL